MGTSSSGPFELIFKPTDEVSVLERIRRLSPEAFEDFMAEAYRRRGYLVEHAGSVGPDGGYDLVLLRDSQTLLVQCKQWLTWTVGVPRVRELVGAMRKVGASHGIFVTTGKYTGPARDFATGMPIELLDGDGLVRLLAPDSTVAAPGAAQTESTDPPLCPRCQRRMVRRISGKGKNLGKPFWGCPTFPRCRGIRQLAA